MFISITLVRHVTSGKIVNFSETFVTRDCKAECMDATWEPSGSTVNQHDLTIPNQRV